MEGRFFIFRLRMTSVTMLFFGVMSLFVGFRVESWIAAAPALFAFPIAILAWLAASEESRKKKKNDEDSL